MERYLFRYVILEYYQSNRRSSKEYDGQRKHGGDP